MGDITSIKGVSVTCSYIIALFRDLPVAASLLQTRGLSRFLAQILRPMASDWHNQGYLGLFEVYHLRPSHPASRTFWNSDRCDGANESRQHKTKQMKEKERVLLRLGLAPAMHKPDGMLLPCHHVF
ncbi:hypothetical protein VFPPC_17361 [Pochonia chlamydosporia 170]|uniref:Uncharacterized protein n=1 Tax=Pochonia chlamydosporia 170 TaxID=1380566 RepID=A0A219ARV4_METCM|nr:hypothetical protein VFPPC_17361 [Pochonia chlamydosporia 170]OWT43490.1 hypothetical protein VFPPC_17361 [Pochonia chlamydosporia 170]